MNAETTGLKDLKPQKMLTPELSADIFSFFELGEPGEITPITLGRSHSNFFVESVTQDTYVVRLLGYVSGGILANEVHLQRQLRSVGVSAPLMLTGKTGEAVYKASDSTTATATSKLPGSHPIDATELDCFLAGKTLGQFHKVGSNLPYQSRTTLLGQERVTQSINKIRMSEQHEQLAELLDVTSELFATPLPEGVMHGDLRACNLLIEGTNVSVLDLESAANGRLLIDIGRTAADMCCDASGTPDSAKTASLIAGYNEERRLTTVEQTLLPKAVLYGHVAAASWLVANNFTDEGAMCISKALKAGADI